MDLTELLEMSGTFMRCGTEAVPQHACSVTPGSGRFLAASATYDNLVHMAGTMCVSDLPDDVLRLVFRCLGPVDLLRSAAVSRRW